MHRAVSNQTGLQHHFYILVKTQLWITRFIAVCGARYSRIFAASPTAMKPMYNQAWKLMYAAGMPATVISDADNPLPRRIALERAQRIAAAGHRVWIEHYRSGQRLYENDREKAYRTASA